MIIMAGPATQVRDHPDTNPIAAPVRTHLRNKFVFILYSFHPCCRTACFLGLSLHTLCHSPLTLRKPFLRQKGN